MSIYNENDENIIVNINSVNNNVINHNDNL